MPLSQAQKDQLVAQHAALGISINALTPDSVIVIPPPTLWPRIAPDLFEIALTDLNCVQAAKMLDGSGGYDGQGHAVHYGDMAGGVTYVNGVADFSEKYSNPSVKPKFGKWADGIPYLEAASDIGVPLPSGVTWNRLINWGARAFGVRNELYMRWEMLCDPSCKTHSNNLGIKLFGFGSNMTGATMAMILEAWQLTNGRLALGTYRYDAEGAQGQEVSDLDLPLGTRDVYEIYVKANTYAGNNVFNHDGIFEARLNNVPFWRRTNYYFFNALVGGQPPGFTGANTQLYPGGTTKPSGPFWARFGSWAVSTKGWIGPPIGYAP